MSAVGAAAAGYGEGMPPQKHARRGGEEVDAMEASTDEEGRPRRTPARPQSALFPQPGLGPEALSM
eukprot:1468220-Pyramimonas_sp.AAC.1